MPHALMRFEKVVVLSMSCLALGCNLFPSSGNRTPGKNAPIMYGGAAPASGGPGGIDAGARGGAGASGTRTDAAVVGLDAAAESSARRDGGPDAAPPSSPDVGAVDADIHDGAQHWIRFGSPGGFTKCTWFSTSNGFCSDAPRSIPAKTPLTVQVYKTGDGGMNWFSVSRINTEASTFDASIDVYVLSPSEMWFISGSVAGQSGSISHSSDGGASWTSLTSAVSAVLSTTPGDGGMASVPLWQLAAVGKDIWLLPQGGNLALSQDQGVTWRKVPSPADFGAASSRSLIPTPSTLFLRFIKAGNSLGLYRWNSLTFEPVEGVLPPSSSGDQTGTWWHSSPNVEGVLFVDRGPLPAWASPFWAYATIDGGRTFQQISTGNIGPNSAVVGLSDGLAFAAAGSLTAYLGGVFADIAGGQYLEIHRTADAGKTWSTLHSEPYPGSSGNYGFVFLAVDPMGNVHAMHYTTDSLGAAISFDAHYVLP